MKTEEVTSITVLPIDIDPKLPESKRKAIVDGFLPIYKQIQELSDEYAAITQSDVTVYSSRLAKRARALRLQLVSIRGKNGLKGVHSELKESAKLEGQVIDLLERKPRELLIEWEGGLEEIEKHEEREQARKEAELQKQRSDILLEYGVTEPDPQLGQMTEEYWETYFTNVRNAYKAEQERLEKEKLTRERKEQSSKYALLIEDYDAIDFGSLTEKRFKEILSKAASKWEKQEEERLEHERQVAELKAKAEEAERLKNEIALRFRKRVSLISGAELKEDGIYYKCKKIAQIKSIEESSDEKFGEFLSSHLEKYNADVAAEEKKRALELEALRQQEEERARLQAERLRMEEERRRVAEETRKEEERLMRLKIKQENSSDKELLLEYAQKWAELELPVCTTPEGQIVKGKLAGMINRGVAWINEQTETL